MHTNVQQYDRFRCLMKLNIKLARNLIVMLHCDVCTYACVCVCAAEVRLFRHWTRRGVRITLSVPTRTVARRSWIVDLWKRKDSCSARRTMSCTLLLTAASVAVPSSAWVFYLHLHFCYW